MIPVVLLNEKSLRTPIYPMMELGVVLAQTSSWNPIYSMMPVMLAQTWVWKRAHPVVLVMNLESRGN
tara:strand:+ start:274 stop:474 length:201 start_codon:yes stop_codon:yes gene_type:complete